MMSESDTSGAGNGRTLVLLHGLGATGAVWTRTVAALAGLWPGPILHPDLPGHGRRDRLDRYSYGSMAADVASGLDRADEHVLVGHSLGGVVALALASGWFGIRVVAATALGVKVEWSDDELARAAALAERPPARFTSFEEALARYRRVAGLDALADPGAPELHDGVVERDGGYELAQDMATFGVGAPPMANLLAAVSCPVTLVCGEHDHMVNIAQLRSLAADAVLLPGVGHNAHIDAPDQVATLALRARSPFM